MKWGKNLTNKNHTIALEASVSVTLFIENVGYQDVG